MKSVATACCCAGLLLLTGCFLGDTVVHKTVSLSIPTSQQQTNFVLSVNDPQVQEALRVVDSVLVANGYSRDLHPIAPEDQARGTIAFYGVCGVRLSSNRLDVGFLETHKRHFSAPVKKVMVQLKDRLSSRYGAERVRLGD